MAAQYPSNLVTTTQLPSNRVNTTLATNSPTHYAVHNNMADELIAIEAELGTLPKGSWNDVRSRLENLQAYPGGAGIYRTITKDVGGTVSGLIAETWPLEYIIDNPASFVADPYNIQMTNERLDLTAVWIPGGVTLTAHRVYHIANASAANDEFSGFCVYSTDGTTLTRRAIATASSNRFSTGAPTIISTAYDSSYAVPAGGGIYYLGVLSAKAAAPTMARLMGYAVRSSSLINMETPSNYPRHIVFSGQTSPASTYTISTGTLTTTNWWWQGTVGTY